MCANIIEALYPSYLYQFLLGGAPIKIVWGRSHHRIAPNSKVYENICLLFVSTFIILTTFNHFFLLCHEIEKGLIKFMTLLYFLVIIGFVSQNFILTRLRKKSTAILWQKLDEIDREICNFGLKLDYKQIKWSTIRFILLGVSNITCYFVYLLVTKENWVHPLKGYIGYSILYLSVLIYISVTCSFLAFIRAISHILDVLIKRIVVEMGKKEGISKKVYKLRVFMRFQQKLGDVLRLTNHVFSLQILFSFGVSFVVITFQSYMILCTVYNQSRYLKYAFAALVWITLSLLEKFVITFASHKCMFRVILFSYRKVNF